MEFRSFRAESVAADDKGKLVFLVTPFDRETTIGDPKRGGFREEVGKGCFSKTLREGDPLMVYQHDLTRPLARVSAGNLELKEGSLAGHEGLVGKATPADTSYARDLRELVKAKVITGMSFGFNVVKDDWYDDDGNRSDRLHGTRRVLREVQLIEVSPVTRPAYGGTSISARDEAKSLIEQRWEAANPAPEPEPEPAAEAARAEPEPAVEAREEEPAEERGPKPYGDVPYADPKNGKYPIDRDHVKAAWAYINQKKNADKYPLNGVSLKSVKSRIKAAMKKFGFTSGSAGQTKSRDGDMVWEFTHPEWRDDDPYFDDFYEIDELEDDEPEPEPERSASRHALVSLATEVLRKREGLVEEQTVDLGDAGFCVILREAKRDDPDGDEYAAIDAAIHHLSENPPDVKAALNVLKANQAARGIQEPDLSTPDDEDDYFALSVQMRSREIELELDEEASSTSNPETDEVEK